MYFSFGDFVGVPLGNNLLSLNWQALFSQDCGQISVPKKSTKTNEAWSSSYENFLIIKIARIGCFLQTQEFYRGIVKQYVVGNLVQVDKYIYNKIRAHLWFPRPNYTKRLWLLCWNGIQIIILNLFTKFFTERLSRRHVTP